MTTRCHRLSVAVGALFFSTAILAAPLFAQAAPAKPPTPAPAKEEPKEEKPPAISTTQHSVKINGVTINYTANAGCLQLTDAAGKPQANVFFIAYVKEPSDNPAHRPITFAFNGGPGAAATFLNLAALGPRRLPIPDDGLSMPTSYSLVDNEFCWLNFTDLVFVDPVGTGFSRALPGVNAKQQYYGVSGDVKSMGDFIRLYITRYERWLSPKFIAGESYGTTRAAGLANFLQNERNVNINGLVLISCALDFQTFAFGDNNDLPYALSLPSYANVAWYHKKLAPDLQTDFDKTRAEVEQWAMGDYLVALTKGDSLSDAERANVIDRLARYTGLPKSDIDDHNLRIRSSYFAKQLLHDQHRVVGIMDGRVTGIPLNPAADRSDFDPSLFLTIAPLTASVNDYVRRELKYESDLNYEVIAGEVNGNWDWETGGMGYVQVSHQLKEAMSRSPKLRVLIASGYFDLTCPYEGTRYAVNHAELDKSLRSNVTFTYYPSGHQMYTNLPSLKQLKADATEFMKKAE